MLQVMLALVPGTLLYAGLINYAVLVNLSIAVVSALVFEAALLALRKRPVIRTLKDGSIVLAAWLLVLCVPPHLPAWQLVVGIFIMCTLGKHLFGGLGHNPFNPAMVAYAVLLVSFPVTMTNWEAVSNKPRTVESTQWDGITSATPLDQISSIKRSISRQDTAADKPREDFSQLVMSSHWIWINACWLLGGIYLLIRRIISWHIPVSILGSLSILYLIVGSVSSNAILAVIPALLSGAILLGAFFVATDPVSSATSTHGKLLYGTGVGILCFVLREYSAYPEGFAFAVLLMNICVPLLDHVFTRA